LDSSPFPRTRPWPNWQFQEAQSRQHPSGEPIFEGPTCFVRRQERMIMPRIFSSAEPDPQLTWTAMMSTVTPSLGDRFVALIYPAGLGHHGRSYSPRLCSSRYWLSFRPFLVATVGPSFCNADSMEPSSLRNSSFATGSRRTLRSFLMSFEFVISWSLLLRIIASRTVGVSSFLLRFLISRAQVMEEPGSARFV